MAKLKEILLNSIPILLMVGLIPFIEDDYLLTLIYVIIILVSLKIKSTKDEIKILIFGFIIMTFFEYIFINTGVEMFVRNSLFGLMPLWLPFLWAYGFVAIKRAVNIF